MRTLYEVGRLSDVMAVADNQDGCWHLDCHDLWGHTLHLTTPQGEACRFNNLDEVSEVAKTIGFSEVKVVEH